MLRIANILYSGGCCPADVFVFCFCFDTQMRVSRKWGAAQKLGKTVNVCVGACRGAPFPNLLKQDSFWGVSL